jgi:hypothetical protein
MKDRPDSSADPAAQSSSASEPEWLELVRAQVGSLRFGTVQLVVHDGRITQIERTGKVRLPAGNIETSRRKISL